ncbi:TonB-dependent receptor domain-containing protein [Sphingomonas sp. YL-JM2C]
MGFQGKRYGSRPATQRQPRTARLAALAMALLPAAAAAEAVGEGAGNGLPDIVVSAQKRSENVQRVPISIQSFDSQALDRLGAGQLTDLDAMAPSLSFGDGNEQGRTGIRGIIDYSRNAGYDSRVGLYVDGVYYSRSWMTPLTLLGIRQVDVLRGPQGTLFGKNTDAGVLSITTIQPSAQPNGEIKAEVGNFGYWRVAGRGNAPLGPNVSLQLAGSHAESTGYYRNVLLGKHNSGVNADMVRAQLRFQPSDDLDVTLAADYAADDNSTLHYTYVPPAGTDPFAFASYWDDRATRRTGGASLTVRKDVAGGFQITSITAYRSGHQFLYFNNETGPVPYLTTGLIQYADQFSQEVRIASPRTENHDFVAGLYYFWGNNKDRQSLAAGSGLGALGLGGLVGKASLTRTSVSTGSVAGFFQASFRPVPMIELFVGARLTYERKKLNDITTNDPTGFIAIPITGYRDRFSDSFLTPKGGINLHLGPDLVLFGTIGREVKSGGWNVEGTTASTFAAGIRFRPETVTSYEAGLKSEFLDRRARLNVTGFYQRFEDFQVFTFVNTVVAGRTVQATSLSNVGKVTSKGVEIDLALIPVEGLTLSGNYTYNKSAYDHYPGGGGMVGTTILDADGVQTPYAPTHKAYLAADYETPLAKGGPLLFAHVGYSVQSSENFDPKVVNPTVGSAYFIKGYGLADARLGIGFAGGRWRASLWSRNLFDKRYVRFATRTVLLRAPAILYGEPRSYGVTLSATF